MDSTIQQTPIGRPGLLSRHLWSGLRWQQCVRRTSLSQAVLPMLPVMTALPVLPVLPVLRIDTSVLRLHEPDLQQH